MWMALLPGATAWPGAKSCRMFERHRDMRCTHAQAGWKMSRNLELNVLHVDDATAWADNVAWRPISGDSLVFDYVYFLHPVRCRT